MGKWKCKKRTIVFGLIPGSSSAGHPIIKDAEKVRREFKEKPWIIEKESKNKLFVSVKTLRGKPERFSSRFSCMGRARQLNKKDK